MTEKQDIKKLIDICKGHKVYIQTHNIPDPDAIASAFGLQHILKSYGISSTICYDGDIDKLSSSKMLDMFGIEMFSDQSLKDEMKADDYIICVDSQKNAGNIRESEIGKPACRGKDCISSQTEWNNAGRIGECDRFDRIRCQKQNLEI